MVQKGVPGVSSQDYSTQQPFLAPTLGLCNTILDLPRQSCKQNTGGSVALSFTTLRPEKMTNGLMPEFNEPLSDRGTLM